jgi:hypothetical protein
MFLSVRVIHSSDQTFVNAITDYLSIFYPTLGFRQISCAAGHHIFVYSMSMKPPNTFQSSYGDGEPSAVSALVAGVGISLAATPAADDERLANGADAKALKKEKKKHKKKHAKLKHSEPAADASDEADGGRHAESEDDDGDGAAGDDVAGTRRKKRGQSGEKEDIFYSSKCLPFNELYYSRFIIVQKT